MSEKIIYDIGIFIFLIIDFTIIYIIFKNNSNNENINYKEETKVDYIKITAKKMKEQTGKLDKAAYIILDVRTKHEYETERIKGSILLTLDEIENKYKTVLVDKNKKIYVYCRSGVRSKHAAKKLISLGYTNVYDLGGIIDYPYEKTTGTDNN